MDTKIYHNNKKINPLKNNSHGLNRKYNTSIQTANRLENKKLLPDYNYILRLKEIEAHNKLLEKIVLEQKKELTDIITTNNKFISILAHDLRSPFASILGVLDLVTENMKIYKIDEIEKYLNIATNSANNTLSLLDNLLVWIFSQHNGKNFNPVKINLYNLFVDEFEFLKISANQKQITLNHNIKTDLYVTADLQMAKTILRNLITNAIKYTEKFGEITVSASEKSQYVEIAIEDNGIGISFEYQKKLFKIDSFQSTLGTENEKGTGLGLLICKDFVEMHGGQIWIESEPGKGSEFKFTLPHYI